MTMSDFFILQLLIPFFLIFYRFRKYRYFYIVAPLMTVAVIAALFGLDYAFVLMPSPYGWLCHYAVSYVAVFVLAAGLFDLSGIDKLFYCVVAFALQNFAHHCCQFFIWLIYLVSEINIEQIYWANFLAYFIAYFAVYLTVFIITLRNKLFELSVPHSRLASIFLALAFVLVMIVLGVFVKHGGFAVLDDPGVRFVYEIYSVILDIFIIVLLVSVFHSDKMRYDVDELERRLAQEGRYYEMAQNNIDLINIKCHDLKHQITLLQKLNDREERSAEIEELKNAVMIYDNIAKTNNEALDCVLTEKTLYCTENGVRFTYIADGSLLDKMTYTDVCALFGNALDNAIESVMKLPDEQKRVVGMKVFKRAGLINIHVENYCPTPPRLEQGMPVTSKGDTKNHGFGMISIRYIVQKYRGNMNFGVVDDMFYLNITLPA